MGCMTPDVISEAEPGTDDRSNLEPPQGSRYIRFGPFQVDQQREEVTRNGSRLKFQGKVYQVLIALLEKRGKWSPGTSCASAFGPPTRTSISTPTSTPLSTSSARYWVTPRTNRSMSRRFPARVIPSSRSRSFPIRRSCPQL